MSYLSQPAMTRQKSLENFTNSFFPEEQEFENRWADVLYGEMPTSPASSTSEFHVINQVEDDLDNLLNEVLSAHDSDESNPASPAQSSDGSLIHEAASSASIIPCEYVPDIEASLQTLQKVSQNHITKTESTMEPTIEAMDTSIPIKYIMVPEEEVFELNSEMKSSPVSIGPLSPATSISTVGSPNPDKAARKRVQNKASSKRYREKVRNKENSLFEAIESLQKRKRHIELELATTKAVNSFLVDQLKQKFGSVLG